MTSIEYARPSAKQTKTIVNGNSAFHDGFCLTYSVSMEQLLAGEMLPSSPYH
jgi:riboflavin synthase alpha subunit